MNELQHVVVSHAEAARLLVDIGYDPSSARAMVTEYLHDCSHRVGVPVYQWGLDAADVEAIAREYEWVDHAHGETLAAARQRAEGQAARWAARARTADPTRAPAFVEHAARQSQLWAERASAPEPFAPARAADRSDDPLDQAHRAVAALPTADERAEQAPVAESADVLEDAR